MHGRISIDGDGGLAKLIMTAAGPALHLVGTHQRTAEPNHFAPGVWQRERMPTLRGLEILDASGWRLLSAGDGNVGMTLARTRIPEVILMDINLPGISGIEALKILRQDPTTAHMPVVALSANAMPRDIALGMEAGFFRYLTKPIKVNEFMAALDLALEFAEKGDGPTLAKPSE